MVVLIAYGGMPLCQVDLHGRATKLRANGKRLALASKYTHTGDSGKEDVRFQSHFQIISEFLIFVYTCMTRYAISSFNIYIYIYIYGPLFIQRLIANCSMLCWIRWMD